MIAQARCVLAAVATAVLLTGCGSEGQEQAVTGTSVSSVSRTTTAGDDSSAAQAARLRQELISPKDLDAAGRGTTARALLDYWSAVQFLDQRRIVAAYDPGLVRAVGVERLVDAVRRASPTYQSARPADVTTVSGAGITTVRYFAPAQVAAGKVVPNSLSLRREQGTWKIVYNSALDDELRLAAQAATQDAIGPATTGISPRALAAGNAAARLQARFTSSRP